VICYCREDIEELRKQREHYYIPSALFDTMQYKLIRLEVKWAYVACLNVMLKSPSYDREGQAFIKDDHPEMVTVLQDLANKKVDKEKIDGYLDELEAKELIERKGRDVYLKKMTHIF